MTEVTLRRLLPVIGLTFGLCWSSPAFPHVPFIEPQSLAPHPWKYEQELRAMGELLEEVAGENGAETPLEFSFETPFVIGPALQAANPIDPQCRVVPDDPFTLPSLTVEDSQAVAAYLAAGDVDVYKFTVTFQDVAQGPVIVSASALPPACQQARHDYPVTALIGPGFLTIPPPFGTADDPDLPLPPEVQEFLADNPNLDILVANNPPIPNSLSRDVFDTDVADPELGLGLAWFLPEGLSQECLLDPDIPCDFSYTISTAVVIPGDYYRGSIESCGN